MRNLLFILSLLDVFSKACPLHQMDPVSDSEQHTRRTTPTLLSRTAITNVRVFDGSCFTQPQTIIINQGVICKDLSNIETFIDGTDQFLIPGLIDSHIHISNVRGLENATSWGVTTALNMACQIYTACSLLRDQSGLADFRSAGNPAVGPDSSHATFQKLPPSQLVTDASDASLLTAWSANNGSDYYKITLEHNGPSYDLTLRLNTAAYALGQQTMAHASDIAAYTQAVETKIDGIQHTPDDGNLTSTLIDQIKRSGQFVTPTLTIHAFALNPPNPLILKFLRGTSSPGNSSWYNILHNARAMYRAGIPVLVGTDAVGPIAPNITLPFGETLHGELKYLVEDVGMTPAEAINAATREAAKWHRLSDRGAIKEGLRADLVLLGSNPLERIENTKDIRGVWVGGRKFELDA